MATPAVPEATSPGLLDPLLRLPYEMVVTESYAPAERQTARERMDLAIRRLKSADEEAMAERVDMMSARDALGNGAVGFGDHHLTVLVRERDLARLDDATAAFDGVNVALLVGARPRGAATEASPVRPPQGPAGSG